MVVDSDSSLLTMQAGEQITSRFKKCDISPLNAKHTVETKYDSQLTYKFRMSVFSF